MHDDNDRPNESLVIVQPNQGRTVAEARDVTLEAVAPAPLPMACPNLSAALSAARDRCKVAHKDKRNEYHKFNYASADEVITVAKAALEGTGLAIIPQVQELTVVGSGNVAFHALNRTIFLSHSSGEFVPLSIRGWPVIPERGRPLDKAFAVALTSSLSYLLRDLLQMPRGDDADMNTRDDRPAAPAKAAPAPQSKPAPAPKQADEPPVPVPELLALLSEAGKSWLDIRQAFGERIDREMGDKLLDDLTADERTRLRGMLQVTVKAKRDADAKAKADRAAVDGLYDDHQRQNTRAMR